MKIPLPQVELQGPQSAKFSAQGVVPMQNYQPQQQQQLGQAIGQAGVAVQQIGERVDLAEAKRAQAAYLDGIREDLEAPEKGYLTRIGKDAADAYDPTIEALNKRKDAVANSLSGRQREMFLEAIAPDERRALSRADAHRNKQVTAWEIGESTALSDSFARQYVSRWNDPDAGALKQASLNEMTDALEAQGVPAGSEQRKAALLEATTKMHAGVLDGLIEEGTTESAKTYLDAHKDEIDPNVRNTAQRRIEAESERERGTIAGLDAAKLGEAEGRASLEEQLRGGKITAREYDIAETTLAKQEGSRIRAQSKKNEDLMRSATVWLDQNRQAAAASLTTQAGAGTANVLAGVNDMPAALRDELMQAGLFAQVERYAQYGRWTTTPEGFELLQTVTPESLRGTEWSMWASDMRPVLDDRDLGGLRQMWEKANEQAPQAKRKYLTSDTQFADQLATYGGITYANPEKPTQDELDRKAFYIFQVETAVADIAAAENREPDRRDYWAYVSEQRERKALTAGGAERPLVTFSRTELAEGPAAIYRDPATGNATTATFAEVESGVTRQQVLNAITAKRDAARRLGATDEVSRLDAILDEQPPLEMAGELARMRSDAIVAAGTQRRQEETTKRVMSEQNQAEAARRQASSFEAAWAEWNAKTGRSPWNNRGLESLQKWNWQQSEGARRANAAKWPGDSTFFFDVWHGLVSPMWGDTYSRDPYQSPSYVKKQQAKK